MIPRIEFNERHFRAALDVPTQIALDTTVPIADRLRAAKIVQDLIKIIWEDELYTQKLVEMIPQSKRPVIFVNENLEEQIAEYNKYQAELAAANKAQANGVPPGMPTSESNSEPAPP